MYDPDSLENRNPALIHHLAGVVRKVVVPYHRATVTGLENVPSGPAILVGNHNGATLSIDSFIFGAALYEAHGIDAVPHGLAHDLPITLPVLNQLLCQFGVMRASPDNARRVFEAGRKVIVYPGGDVEAMRPYRRRNEVDFADRTGFARLAIRNGVPIVPIVAEGAHGTLFVIHDFPSIAKLLSLGRRARINVFPLALLLPYGLWFGPTPPYFPLPARITIEVLEPIEFDGGPEAAEDDDYVREAASVVEAHIQLALTRLAASR